LPSLAATIAAQTPTDQAQRSECRQYQSNGTVSEASAQTGLRLDDGSSEPRPHRSRCGVKPAHGICPAAPL